MVRRPADDRHGRVRALACRDWILRTASHRARAVMNERKTPSAPRANGSHVLLLGATGFIGVHVRDALVRAGYRVTCGARSAVGSASCPSTAVDYTRDRAEADWL